MLTLFRRLALLTSLVCLQPAHAGALNFAIVASDGTPARELLATRAEMEFLDQGTLPDNVVRLREPSVSDWADAFLQARSANARDVFVIVLGDVDVSTAQPALVLGTGRIMAAEFRAELDALSPTIGGGELVVIDGNRAGDFLTRLANPQYALSQRQLFGSTRSDYSRDDAERANGYMNYFLTKLYMDASAFDVVGVHKASVSSVGSVTSWYPTGWMDTNGNGVPNETADGNSRRMGKITYDAPLAGGGIAGDRAIVVATNDNSGVGYAFLATGRGMVRMLKSHGLDDASIAWLSNTTATAIGTPDAPATRAALFDALAAVQGADDVVVYMTGHGTATTVNINGTERVEYAELAPYFAAIQASISGRLTVVLETCYAGGLIQQFALYAAAAPGAFPNGPPTILTSSAANQTSYFFQSGQSSFTAQWSGRMSLGAYVDEASAYSFRAFTASAYFSTRQIPQIDADADGVANEPEDYTRAHYSLTGPVVVQLPDPGPGPIYPPPCTNCM